MSGAQFFFGSLDFLHGNEQFFVDRLELLGVGRQSGVEMGDILFLAVNI